MYVKLFVTIFLYIVLVNADKYLEESQDYCEKTNYLTSCGIYKMLNLIKQFAQPITSNGNSGLIQLIKVNESYENELLFTTSRFLPGDSEFSKMTKFLKRMIVNFLEHQAVAISLPNGFKVFQGGVQIGEFLSYFLSSKCIVRFNSRWEIDNSDTN